MQNIYTVENDWLKNTCERVTPVPCSYEKYSQGRNICDYVVLHYTGGSTASSAHTTYQSKDANVSWHLTIGRDGKVFQLLDFRKIAWHAGPSKWYKEDGSLINGMNRWSIGIEMIAAGPLTLKNDGYYTWFNKMVPNEEVFIDINGKPWHNYTFAQKQSLKALMPALIKQYKIKDILGHEEISPQRKIDPGPPAYKLLDELKTLL